MATRYSDEFIDRFEELYCKHGRDVDCIEVLRDEYMSQYPFLNSNVLTKIRAVRSERFEKAREERVKLTRTLNNKRDRDLLLMTKGLNSRTIEAFMQFQEIQFKEFDLLDPSDEDFYPKMNALLGNISAVQTKLNVFSGLDMDNQLKIFKHKLLSKKIIEDQSLEKVIDLFGAGDGVLEMKEEKGRPTLTFVEKDEDQ